MAAKLITIDDYLSLGFENQGWWDSVTKHNKGRTWRIFYSSPYLLHTNSKPVKSKEDRTIKLDLQFNVKNINQVRKVMTIYGAFT